MISGAQLFEIWFGLEYLKGGGYEGRYQIIKQDRFLSFTSIVSDNDLKQAAQKQEEYLKNQDTFTEIVTIPNIVIKKEANQ